MKRFFSFLLLGLVLLILPFSVFAQSNMRSGEVVTLNRGEVIERDYFATGERVVLSGTVNGDAYLAGGNVIIDGTIDGDLLVAGGNIEIRGDVGEDIRVTGGNIDIFGNVGGNITAAGGNIGINPGSEVGGSLVAAGGNIEVAAPVNKEVTVGAGQLVIASRIGGDVLATSEQVVLSEGAMVNGNLTYFAQKQVTIAPEATVSGQITRNYPPQKAKSQTAAAGFNLAWGIFNFISALVVGIIAILLGPNIIRQKSETILEKPWPSFGIGLLSMFLVPFSILLLMVTIIGIPIAVFVMVFYILLLFFAKVFVSIAIGIMILRRLNRKLNLIWTFIAGLLIYSLITMVPILGSLVSFISVIIGTGAYLITDYGFYQSLRSKKLI